MNCIDALEGSAKQIIIELHKVFVEHGLDTTDFILNIKAVISGVDAFLQHNAEIDIDPALPQKILYDFAKQLWLATVLGTDTAVTLPETNRLPQESHDYHTYCFDYIYAHNVYPR